jgi:RNA polymerase sigma-70 factor (ECF subfamily)
MAGLAIPGDAILQSTHAVEAEAPATVESLAQQHGGLVFRIAYSILRNHHDAEDAAQECFLRVLKYGRELAHVRNTKTWLARIAWTVALDRRPRRTPSGQETSDAESESVFDQLPDRRLPADEQLAGKQMQQILERMIATLPDDLRQTLELSTVQELNSSEIAEVLKIPEGSVRTRLMRARKLLKEKLSSLLEVKKHG